MRESDLLLWELGKPVAKSAAEEASRRYPDIPGHKPGAPETSAAAAEAVKPQACTLRLKVLSELEKGDKTADEVAEALGESVLSIRPRFTECRRLRHIHDSGVRRPNASGRKAVVWAIGRLAFLITFGVLLPAFGVAGQFAELPQALLEPVEQVDVCNVPYDNSLFIKPLEPGYLGDDARRRFRCGQTVQIRSNPEQIAIVMDYRVEDGVWLYRVQKAHYAKGK